MTRTESRRTSSGFWAGGSKAHFDSLKRQYDGQLSVLRDYLREASTKAQRAEIREQINLTKKEFRLAAKKIGRLVF